MGSKLFKVNTVAPKMSLQSLESPIARKARLCGRHIAEIIVETREEGSLGSRLRRGLAGRINVHKDYEKNTNNKYWEQQHIQNFLERGRARL